MEKQYLDRKMKQQDRLAIERKMREIVPLVNFPMIGVDLYNMSQMRAWSKNNQISIRALLDNNIASKLISLAYNDGTEHVRELDAESRLVCGIAAFLIYSGIEIVPEVAHYERGRLTDPDSRSLDDLVLRYIDHVDPQIFADLFTGKMKALPTVEFTRAKIAVHSNTTTVSEINRHNYEDFDQPGLGIAYSHILMSWLLFKTEANEITRLEKYTNWVYSSSLYSLPTVLFNSIFLSNKRYPKMLKFAGSNSSKKIIQAAKNTAWDLYYLGTLEILTTSKRSNDSWCFVTRDRLLSQIGSELFSLKNEAELRNYIGKFYGNKGVELLMLSKSRIRSGSKLQPHIEEVSSTQSQLEKHLEKLVQDVLAGITVVLPN